METFLLATVGTTSVAVATFGMFAFGILGIHRSARRCDVTIPITLIAVIGLVVYVVCRYLRPRVRRALLCLVLGIALADTSLTPEFRGILPGLMQWLLNP